MKAKIRKIVTVVDEILTENGRASGVRLASGEVIRAGLVVSNADVGHTYRDLIELWTAKPAPAPEALAFHKRYKDDEFGYFRFFERTHFFADILQLAATSFMAADLLALQDRIQHVLGHRHLFDAVTGCIDQDFSQLLQCCHLTFEL